MAICLPASQRISQLVRQVSQTSRGPTGSSPAPEQGDGDLSQAMTPTRLTESLPCGRAGKTQQKSRRLKRSPTPALSSCCKNMAPALPRRQRVCLTTKSRDGLRRAGRKRGSPSNLVSHCTRYNKLVNRWG